VERFTENVNLFSEQLTNGGDVVTDSALKELEARNKVGPTQTSKSTLIIHSVQRVSTLQAYAVGSLECGMVLVSTKAFALRRQCQFFSFA
jgi:hypothetical protein